MDRVCNVQEQLVRQMELASEKDDTIQSITDESRRAHTRLRIAEDKIKRLNSRLLDLRVGERKKPLDEQVVIRDRHERRQTQDALRDAPSVDHDRRPLHQRPTTTWPNDTGQPPLPPEQIRHTGTPPIAAAFDGESEVAKEQRAAEEELIRHMPQGPVEPQGTRDVNPNERERESLRDEIVRLQEQLVVAKKKQRIAEEEARDVRRELDQSKETLREAEEDGRGVRRELDQSKATLREVETHVMALEYELGLCQATLRKAQDARHASKVELDEVAQLLRQHQAESESSMARAEASQFKFSQATLLCAALQERVTELEAQVKTLSSTQKYPATRAAHTNSRSIRPTATYLEATTRDPDKRDSDSIFMTVSPSMSRHLDLSSPPLSLPSRDSSYYLSPQKCSATPPACASPQFCPIDTDPKAITHNTDIQDCDSIYMTVPPSLPCILDFSLPPSSSFCLTDIDLDVITPDADPQILDSPLPPPSSHISLDISHHEASLNTHIDLDSPSQESTTPRFVPSSTPFAIPDILSSSVSPSPVIPVRRE
ncbi:hypothetical protein DFH94DRAFT_725620 [Russula ochroleuca]|uniref:Uncharacterized protein n=1 Tax=Russula ochroleuca TaxID=152965 RepID=A0A9P5N1H2_9AGAM|nr:hypothetical protein DFH94DRAFT_725620 [Russula ochroleuca]